MIGHLSPALFTLSPTLCADNPAHIKPNNGYNSRNMAARTMLYKTEKFVQGYFIYICSRKHITRDIIINLSMFIHILAAKQSFT